jgi:hypothetical protein
LYIDNGPSFQTGRFHAACKNELLDINVVHSKPYVSEGRGVCERFNRTLKEQFESEAKNRDELLTLDELNAYFEAWIAERYHRDTHSETRQSPHERFWSNVTKRPTPDLEQIDELLRLRQKSKVHKKWSTVQVKGTRYVVDPALRGRKVHSLYDPFDPSYVLIEHNRSIIQRAYPQKPGQMPPQPEPTLNKMKTDYLDLLRQDHEKHLKAELEALRFRKVPAQLELKLGELETLCEKCRGVPLSENERIAVTATFRKLRPIKPELAHSSFQSAQRRFGIGLHISVYLNDLKTQLVHQRTQGGKKK